MSNAIRIIETVGPPGAGKTTLANALRSQNTQIEVEIFPYFRTIRHVPFFTRSLVEFSPTLAYLWQHKDGHWLSKRDIALMTILTGWDQSVAHQASSTGKIILLEEGAICLLAKLYGFGSELLKEHCAQSWWEARYRDWARTLDLVVTLSAPAQKLVNRIRTREEQFEFKELTDPEACIYLEAIQQAQAHQLMAIGAMPDRPEILHFDTTQQPMEQIAAEILKMV